MLVCILKIELIFIILQHNMAWGFDNQNTILTIGTKINDD